MQLILITILVVGLCIAAIAIKLLVKKNGEFAGTCSSNNPLLKGEDGACGICGARPEEACKS